MVVVFSSLRRGVGEGVGGEGGRVKGFTYFSLLNTHGKIQLGPGRFRALKFETIEVDKAKDLKEVPSKSIRKSLMRVEEDL